jgi:hypothetical protein
VIVSLFVLIIWLFHAIGFGNEWNREYDLFEMYPSSTAFSLGPKNDASFATEGVVQGNTDVKQRFRYCLVCVCMFRRALFK